MPRAAASRTKPASATPKVVRAGPVQPKRTKRAAPAVKAKAPTATPVDPTIEPALASTPAERRALTQYGRDNPDALTGDALRELANERGMAMSEMKDMPPAKIREQLRYITARAYGA